MVFGDERCRYDKAVLAEEEFPRLQIPSFHLLIVGEYQQAGRDGSVIAPHDDQPLSGHSRDNELLDSRERPSFIHNSLGRQGAEPALDRAPSALEFIRMRLLGRVRWRLRVPRVDLVDDH